MSLAKKVTYIKEPTDLQCGQAVLAMLTEKSIEEIIKECGTDKETTLKQMKESLTLNGITFDGERKLAETKEDLPSIALLSLETPRCWHWSLWYKGTVYDPEHGVLSDFPESNRKFYFEIYDKTVGE
jgi:hypothetical protein